MSKLKTQKSLPYQIVIKGHLSKNWQDWFGGIDLAVEGENSVITAFFPDQAALHGALNKIRDLNLELLKVEKLAVIDKNKIINHNVRKGGTKDTKVKI